MTFSATSGLIYQTYGAKLGVDLLNILFENPLTEFSYTSGAGINVPAQNSLPESSASGGKEFAGFSPDFMAFALIKGVDGSELFNPNGNYLYTYKLREFLSKSSPNFKLKVNIIEGSSNNNNLNAISLKGDHSSLMYGYEGDDTLSGTTKSDIIYGGLGNDSVFGNKGSDFISGSYGSDRIDGGLGNDTIDGGSQSDFLYASVGNDLVYGVDGNDYVKGGYGNDTLIGGRDNDTLIGESGSDLLIAGVENKYSNYVGIIIGKGDNYTNRLAGDNLLIGGDGSDTLIAGNGNDIALGGAGSDFIDAGLGNNTITTGAGNDSVFVYKNAGTTQTITDFDPLNDNIVVKLNPESATFYADSDGDLVMSYGSQTTFTNLGIDDVERVKATFVLNSF